MAGYEVRIKASAVRELEAIGTKSDRRRIVRKIHALAVEPRPRGCEKLSGEEKYRVRQGRYRVVYSVDDESRTLLVVKIGHRREVYR